MTKRELRSFKELLLQQRAELLSHTSLFKNESFNETPSTGDEGDQAVSELNLSMSLRLQERQMHLIHKIDYALAKIDNGTFGLCEQCEEALSISRLRARPVASLCITCKEEQERHERIFA